jgi:predicted glycogen debranching enzyme
LCLATGRIADARRILLQWSDVVSEGMLPNRFCEAEAQPEFNAVDASLWFIIAVHDLLRTPARGLGVSAAHRQRLTAAVDAILTGYTRGTRFGIHADTDGLLAAGVPGVQLTWMDAKIGGEVITPRIGKAVEVQALWIHALEFGGAWSPAWRAQAVRAAAAFQSTFWNARRSCLFDVVDVDHVRGRTDDRLRPNQILAVGGLARSILGSSQARQVVDVVEQTLLTPMGLRTLAPGEPGYAPRCEGDATARDRAYHQGTVWPWLMGPFVDAWVRVRGNTPSARREARDRFVRPLLAKLDASGVGHLPEITDAEEPFTPRGCPFQAWSVGELIRLTAASDR